MTERPSKTLRFPDGKSMPSVPPSEDPIEEEEILFSDPAVRECLRTLPAPLPCLPSPEEIVATATNSAKRAVEFEWPNDDAAVRVERLRSAATKVSSEAELSWIADDALTLAGGFSSASVFVVFPIRGTVELTSVSGRRRELEGRLRYPLDRPRCQRDIQTDIVQERRAEVLSPGFHQRFFRYLYNRTRQHNDWKVFVPLMIARDGQGSFHQREVSWERGEVPAGPDRGKVVQWRCRVPERLHAEVVGTLTVSRKREPSESDVRAILEKATHEYAGRVFDTTARSLAERCLVEAMQVARAHSGTIYLFPDGVDPEWLDSVDAEPNESLLEALGIPRHQHSRLRVNGDEAVSTLESRLPCELPAPRVEGSGSTALKRRRACFLTREELLRRSPEMVRQRIDNLFVAPLFCGKLAYGLVYLHNVQEEPGRLREVCGLLERASDLLGIATHQVEATREKRRSKGLFALQQAVVSRQRSKNSLAVLANEAYAFTGADVVTVIRFGPKVRLKVAGRYRVRPRWNPKKRDLAPIGDLHRAEDARSDLVLRRMRGSHFADAEGIVSSVVIPLREHSRIVGALVVDYRDRQRFPAWQLEELRRLGRISSIALRLFDLAGRADRRDEAAQAQGSLETEVLRALTG